jgi:hypothetical protein
MRIPTIMIPDVKGLLADKQEQAKLIASLKVGDVVRAKLVALQGDFAIILVSGQRMSIPATSVSSYVLGDNLGLDIVEKNDSGVVFSLIAKSDVQVPSTQTPQPSSNLATDLTLERNGQLRALGFLATDLNSEIVESLKAFNVPITKESIGLVKEHLFYLRDSVQTLKEVPQALSAEHWHQSPKEFMQSTRTLDVQDASTVLITKHNPTIEVEPSSQLQAHVKTPLSDIPKELGFALTKEPESLTPKQSHEITFTEHLSEQIQETLSKTLKTDQRMIETLAFMQRHKLEVTLFNVTLIQRQLSGDLGFFKGLNELLSTLDSPSLPEKNIIELLNKLETTLQKNIFSENELDVDQLKEHIKSAQDLSDILKELKTSSDPQKMKTQLETLQKTQEVLKSATEWSTVLMPMTIHKQLEDLEIYIRKDSKGKKKYSPDDFLIYIAISTENLQRLRIKIQTANNQLNVTFIAQNDAVKEQLSGASNVLLSALQLKSDKRVSIGFETWEEGPNLAILERLQSPTTHSFDVLI